MSGRPVQEACGDVKRARRWVRILRTTRGQLVRILRTSPGLKVRKMRTLRAVRG